MHLAIDFAIFICLGNAAVGVAAIGVGCRVMSNVGSSYGYDPRLFGAWNTFALAKSHAM